MIIFENKFVDVACEDVLLRIELKTCVPVQVGEKLWSREMVFTLLVTPEVKVSGFS